MKKSLILIIYILCLLGMNAVNPDDAYSASPIENIFFGGKSLDEVLGVIERARLKGINDVYIVIEKVSDSARSVGINEDNIRTAVEIKIRRSGIKVKEKDSLVMFYVNVGVTAPISGLYGFSVRVEVKDMVFL